MHVEHTFQKPPPDMFYKKGVLKNTFFTEHFRTTASEITFHKYKR